LATETANTSTSNSIPINFKIKIAKEVYDALPPDEQRKVIERVEEDRKKMYRPIRAIEDAAEKDKKLLAHEKSDISISSSLTPFSDNRAILGPGRRCRGRCHKC